MSKSTKLVGRTVQAMPKLKPIDMKPTDVVFKSKDQILYEKIIEGCNHTSENLEDQKKVNDMMRRAAELELKECT